MNGMLTLTILCMYTTALSLKFYILYFYIL